MLKDRLFKTSRLKFDNWLDKFSELSRNKPQVPGMDCANLWINHSLALSTVKIAVIAVAPTGKASFVYSYIQTRLRGQYNGKWPFSLVYVLKPLITAIRAINCVTQWIVLLTLLGTLHPSRYFRETLRHQLPVSRKSRKLGLEKPLVKLRLVYSVKLVFSYVTGI